jgi:hypothetical protein
MKDIMVLLSEAPDTQVDPSVTKTCRELSQREYTAAEVKTLLDEIVHSSLASDFFVSALNAVWNMKLKEEEAV